MIISDLQKHVSDGYCFQVILMKEKRSLERYCLTVPVKIELMDNPDTPRLEAFTKDVSSGGTFLTLEKELEVGQKVRLKLFLSINKLQEFFEMDNQVRIDVSGEVIRKEKNGVGIQFDKKYTILPIADDQGCSDS